MEAVYHAEGRVRLVTTGSSTVARYEYTLRDHLGNARVTFSDLNGDRFITWNDAGNPGIPINGSEILEVHHYFPFGHLQDGPWEQGANNPPAPGGIANKYRYNGKELNTDFGLNWSDYGARWYDGVTGRWWSADPMMDGQEAWSPYAYVWGNPMRMTDPDGRWPDYGWRAVAAKLAGSLTGTTSAVVSDLTGISIPAPAISNRAFQDAHEASSDATHLLMAAVGGGIMGSGGNMAAGGIATALAAAPLTEGLSLAPVVYGTVAVGYGGFVASNATMNMLANKASGNRRESETTAELQKANPDAKIQNEQYLRDKDGKIATDPTTGKGR